jgi:hypothetical protein
LNGGEKQAMGMMALARYTLKHNHADDSILIANIWIYVETVVINESVNLLRRVIELNVYVHDSAGGEIRG